MSLDLPRFGEHSLWVNMAVFVAAAIVVWLAGTRIARYADTIARVTGIGHAVAGMLLLAGVTSLPEVAVTVTSSIGGNAELAVNNLLGSIAMQVAVLAVADALIGKDALTSVIPDPGVLLQVALNDLLLALFAAAAMIGDAALFGFGAGSLMLALTYVGSIVLIAKSRKRTPWRAHGPPQQLRPTEEQAPQMPVRALALRTALAAVAILVAGFVLSQTGEAIAADTGIGQSFGGYMLVAISTSLPEVSTVVASVRLRRYVMAVSDIFGTNLFNIGLVFVVDLAYRGSGPILNEVGRFSIFAALLGILLTTIFLIGLVERRDKTVARMGIDSFAAIAVYLAGSVVLFTLR